MGVAGVRRRTDTAKGRRASRHGPHVGATAPPSVPSRTERGRGAAAIARGFALPQWISVGIAVLAPGRETRPTLMAAADAALYRAKAAGRNRTLRAE